MSIFQRTAKTARLIQECGAKVVYSYDPRYSTMTWKATITHPAIGKRDGLYSSNSTEKSASTLAGLNYEIRKLCKHLLVEEQMQRRANLVTEKMKVVR